MSEKTQVTFRMRPEFRDQLKIISAFERKPMGDVLEDLIAFRYSLKDKLKMLSRLESKSPIEIMQELIDEKFKEWSGRI